MRAAVFLDRDGVINRNRDDYVRSWKEFVFLPNVFKPLRLLAQSHLMIIVVTNRSAINRGLVEQDVVKDINARMVDEICHRGGRGDAISDIEAALAAGAQPIPVLTGRGREEAPLLLQRGYDRIPVAQGLAEAVAFILEEQSLGRARE